MSTFVGAVLAILGCLCIIAGATHRGTQLFTALSGTELLGTSADGTEKKKKGGTSPAQASTSPRVSYA